MPTVEETDRYITSRLLVSGATETGIFSAEAIDYIYRCSEGIPRNINNLCDNALVAGYAAGDKIVDRSIIEEVADMLDMVPGTDYRLPVGEERELAAGIFSDTNRAELWATGIGNCESTN